MRVEVKFDNYEDEGTREGGDLSPVEPFVRHSPYSSPQGCDISVCRDDEDDTCDRLAVAYFTGDTSKWPTPLCSYHLKSIRRWGMRLDG